MPSELIEAKEPAQNRPDRRQDRSSGLFVLRKYGVKKTTIEDIALNAGPVAPPRSTSIFRARKIL